MKLLLDANISWRLCLPLAEHFGECLHVNKVGIVIPPSDAAIWDYAKENDCTIISHDADFSSLLLRKGYPPKVILLKTGNIDTATTLNLIVKTKEAILKWSDEKTGLLEINIKLKVNNEK